MMEWDCVIITLVDELLRVPLLRQALMGLSA